jgi:inosine-uridine nucleoside N-ribohydrolase
MSNLATVLSGRPALADRLHVTQASGTRASGALARRRRRHAEHNLRLDPAAAAAVLAALSRLRLVTPDVAGTPLATLAEIAAGGDTYQRLAGSDRPWAQTLVAHLDQWFDRCYPVSVQHDPLALAAAFGIPFISFDLGWVRLDEAGQLSRYRGGDEAGQPGRRPGGDAPDGAKVLVTADVDYPVFMRWLAQQLDPTHEAVATSTRR